MDAIDLIILGMLKQKPMSAQDIKKLIEYRRISRWVKIRTSSINKKILQLQQCGMISNGMSSDSIPSNVMPSDNLTEDGNIPEKSLYSITEKGNNEFERLMMEISISPISIFIDFNAVIVNLQYLSPLKKKLCLDAIAINVSEEKMRILNNLAMKKDLPSIPNEGMAVLKQQLVLIEAIEKWLESLNI